MKLNYYSTNQALELSKSGYIMKEITGFELRCINDSYILRVKYFVFHDLLEEDIIKKFSDSKWIIINKGIKK